MASERDKQAYNESKESRKRERSGKPNDEDIKKGAEDYRNREYSRRKSTHNRRVSEVSSALQVLSYIVILLVIIGFIRYAQGQISIPTFSGLLETLTNVPDVSIPFLNVIGFSLGDWGIFNFLRDLIASGLNCLNIIVFAFNGILNIILYVVYFMQWIFIV